jgi:hypothetical protein
VVAGRTTVQYVNAGTSQFCSQSNIHLKFCQLHENSGYLFVLGFGTRKIFSKYGSSQYVPPLGHTDPPVFSLRLRACVWFVHRLAVEALNTQQP